MEMWGAVNGMTGLRFNNIAMTYDFYCYKYKDIIVSEKALNVLKQHKLDVCTMESYI